MILVAIHRPQVRGQGWIRQRRRRCSRQGFRTNIEELIAGHGCEYIGEETIDAHIRIKSGDYVITWKSPGTNIARRSWHNLYVGALDGETPNLDRLISCCQGLSRIVYTRLCECDRDASNSGNVSIRQRSICTLSRTALKATSNGPIRDCGGHRNENKRNQIPPPPRSPNSSCSYRNGAFTMDQAGTAY